MTRMRSPNYPSIPLGQAIDLTDKIFRADRTNTIDKDVAATHMGYSGLNGRTLKLMGALSQYGLLDKVGKGKVRVSDTAVSILHGIDADEKSKAVSIAASAPPLFKRIRDNFDSPSEQTITSYLMKEGFTDAAVGPVLKSYSETNAYLASHGVSESYGDEADDVPDSNPDDQIQEKSKMPTEKVADAASAQRSVLPRATGGLSALPLNDTTPLFNFETIRIETEIDNPSDLAKLIERLEKLKPMLPTPTEH